MMSAKVYKINHHHQQQFRLPFFPCQNFHSFPFDFPLRRYITKGNQEEEESIFSRTDPEKTGKVKRDGSPPVERLFIFHLLLLLLVDTQNRHTQDEREDGNSEFTKWNFILERSRVQLCGFENYSPLEKKGPGGGGGSPFEFARAQKWDCRHKSLH